MRTYTQKHFFRIDESQFTIRNEGPFIYFVVYYTGGGVKFRKRPTITFSLHFVSKVGFQLYNAGGEGVKHRFVTSGPVFDTHDSMLLYVCSSGSFHH